MGKMKEKPRYNLLSAGMKNYHVWKKRPGVLVFRTIMPIDCIYGCGVYGFKDGKGSKGITSGICPSCKKKGKDGSI